jgi:hypothetical protein
MQVIISTEGKRKVNFAPITKFGNPATLDGIPTLEILTPDTDVTLGPDENGDLLFVVSGSTPTTAEVPPVQVKVTGDADMGDGITPVEEIFDVIIVTPQASSLGTGFGEEVAK